MLSHFGTPRVAERALVYRAKSAAAANESPAFAGLAVAPSVLGALGALFELSNFRGEVAVDGVAALGVIEDLCAKLFQQRCGSHLIGL